MGREDTDGLSSSQILYPCMQCTDVFFMEVRTPLIALFIDIYHF